MKKNLILAMAITALIGTLSGCSGNKEKSNSVSENSGFISDQSLAAGNSSLTSDQNITSAKRYRVDFQEITENQAAALFKSVPQKETNEYGTTEFTVEDEKASLGRHPGVAGEGTYNTVVYYTKQGTEYDTAAYRKYSEIAANRDLDFLTAADAEKEIEKILLEFIPTGVSVKAYAITKEYYSQYIQDRKEQDEKDKEEAELYGSKYTERDYGRAADYYYFKAEQTVDSIPIQVELIGNIDTGTQTWGSFANGVLCEDGFGYLWIFSPYKIIEEVETSEKFITFSEAERMLRDKNDSFLTTEDVTVNYSRLVYVILRADDNSLILTPAWEIFYNDEYNDEFVFRVNAYTGEEVITV